MALTTTQVNQAFLATLGRPAEGSAATWGSTSLSLDALLDSIFIAENTDGDFVEYLYQNILGRASDAEGKAFWNSLLATTSKEAVLAQFKAAVIAAGQADPANADYQSFIAQNKAFVTELYTNLLGRSDAASADAEGVEFWANALASGTSKGALLAQFTAAALSDPNSDDAQTLNAKVNVANAITAKFNNFNADVTADQKKAALDTLKATMTEVVAGSTAEDFQERIDTFAGNYQNRVAQVFTTKDDDQLDASEATASTVFSGNVNLIDPAKGTIQTTDSVAGNSNYTDTLRVSVTSDSANKDFSLASNLPTSVSSIEKLIITAGAANVSGTLNGTNYAESTTITSTGDVDLKISGEQTELKVTAGDKKDAAITVESGSLKNYVGSAAKDSITVNDGSVKTLDTGAGKDTVEIKGTGTIQNEGSIKLGSGDDELTIAVALAKSETLDKISLDGGEGSKDKLTISTDITAVNSITGFETIDAKTGATISADAANSLTSSTKLANTSSLTIEMNGKNSLNLKNLKVGNDADNKLGTANVAISNVAKGEVTLTTTTNNAIVETITLKETATDGTTGPVTIKGIGAAKLDATSTGKADGSNGDKLKIDGITLESGNPTQVKNYDKLGTLTANTVYYINTAISSADDLASKSTVLAFMDNNTTLASGKVLVALNNSAQNKSYVFEIKAGTGTANAITRDDITLKAIVDNAINSKDVISGGAIEFVAGTEERDVKPSGSDSKVISYVDGQTTLTLAADKATYNSQDVSYTDNKVAIKGVNNSLKVTGDVTKTAEVYVSGTVNASTTITKEDAASATVNVYLGGDNTAAGTTALDLSGVTKLFDNTNAVNDVYANVNGQDLTIKNIAALDSQTVKLDKEGVNAKIVLSAEITDFTSAVNLGTTFTGGDKSDSVKATLGSVASGTIDLTLTSANDTLVVASVGAVKDYDIKSFTKFDTVSSSGDKINLSAILTNKGTADDITAIGVSKQVTADTVFFGTVSKDIASVASSDVTALFTAKQGAASANIVIKANDGLAVYSISDTTSGGSGLSATKIAHFSGVNIDDLAGANASIEIA